MTAIRAARLCAWAVAVIGCVQAAFVQLATAQVLDYQGLDTQFPDSTYVYRIVGWHFPDGHAPDDLNEDYYCTPDTPVSGTILYQFRSVWQRPYDARWGPFKTPREMWAVMGDITRKDGQPISAITYMREGELNFGFSRPDPGELRPSGSEVPFGGEVPYAGGGGTPINPAIPVIALLGVLGLLGAGALGLLVLKTLLQPRPPALGSRAPPPPYPPGSPVPLANNTTFGSPFAKSPVELALSVIPRDEPLCAPGCEITPQHPTHNGARPIEQFQQETPGTSSPAPPTRTRYQVGEPDLFPGQPQWPGGNMPDLAEGNPGVFGAPANTNSGQTEVFDPIDVLQYGGAESMNWFLLLARAAASKHGAGGDIGYTGAGVPGGAGGGSPDPSLVQPIVEAVRDATAEIAAAQGTVPGSSSTGAPASAIPPPIAQPQWAVVKTKPGPDPRASDADTTAFAGITVGGVAVADVLTGGPRGRSEAAAVAAGDYDLATAFDDFPEWANRTADSVRQAYAGDLGAMEAALNSQYNPEVAAELIARAGALDALDAAGVPLPSQLFGNDPDAYRIVENPPAAMLTSPAQPGGFDPDVEATWHQQLQGVAY